MDCGASARAGEGPRSVEIRGREIGPGHPCFIVAEAGVNHNGDPELARGLVDAAAETGVDAVKFQTFKAERLVSPAAPKAAYQARGTRADESQLEMLRKLELSPDVHRELFARCRERGLLFMSTPFDEESADLLDELGVAVFKIGSGELTNWPFLKYVAEKKKPIILSTGMSYLSEVDEAVRTIRQAGNDRLILLHCVSNYPADPADVNLRAMRAMEAAFGLPVGFSDHTLGIDVAVAAVALGAAVVEKHFTLDRDLPGPDHRSSLEPDQLTRLVKAIRDVELALGSGEKRPAASEQGNRQVVRRSLHLRVDAEAGTAVQREMLVALRPGGGIGPEAWDRVVGHRLRHSLRAGAQLAWEDLA